MAVGRLHLVFELVFRGQFIVDDLLDEIVVPLGAGPDDRSLDLWCMLWHQLACLEIQTEEDGVR